VKGGDRGHAGITNEPVDTNQKEPTAYLVFPKERDGLLFSDSARAGLVLTALLPVEIASLRSQ
jgi:hypothetical protein